MDLPSSFQREQPLAPYLVRRRCDFAYQHGEEHADRSERLIGEACDGDRHSGMTRHRCKSEHGAVVLVGAAEKMTDGEPDQRDDHDRGNGPLPNDLAESRPGEEREYHEASEQQQRAQLLNPGNPPPRVGTPTPDGEPDHERQQQRADRHLSDRQRAHVNVGAEKEIDDLDGERCEHDGQQRRRKEHPVRVSAAPRPHERQHALREERAHRGYRERDERNDHRRMQRELLTHDDRDDRAENAHRQDGAYETSRPVEEVADVRARNHHPFGEHGQEDADSEHDSDECLDAHGEPLLERLACVPLLQCLLYAPPPARRTLMRRTAVRTVA